MTRHAFPSKSLDNNLRIKVATVSYLFAAVMASSAEPAPTEVLGDWTSGGLTSSINYVNRSTGASAPPSGAIANYTFHPDGTYVESGLLQSTAYSCTTKLYFHRKGRYSFEGSQLILDETASKLKSEDNCRKQWNYEKNNGVQRKVLEWKFETQDGARQFVVKGATGQPVVYRRK